METPEPPTDHSAAPAEQKPAEALSFSSSHTSNFPDLIRRMGISLLVSTYQAGRLIVVRADGDSLNTHFRGFSSPMGIAYDAERGDLALGTKNEVWNFRLQPDVAAKIEPPGSHDAAFMPRRRRTTGDIRIHEIEWIGRELWAVNTRFSCLCTFDDEHSFVPRWRPWFISALAPEDRCHLNGFTVVDGVPRYVTCLGQTNTAGGWRENKASGGCLIDIPAGQVVLDGLCMPHSPRVYNGQTWILESGIGALSKVNLREGKTEVVARMPGFTRGIDFFGQVAFVGLSQVRESAIFSGIPLMDDCPERACGVWAVHLPTGRILAYLQFEGIVQEIFAVKVLPNIRYPDLLHEPGPLLDSSFVLPDDALESVPASLRP